MRRELAALVADAIPDLTGCAAYAGGPIPTGSAAVVESSEGADIDDYCALRWNLEVWATASANDLAARSETFNTWAEQFAAALTANPTLNRTASQVVIERVNPPTLMTSGGGDVLLLVIELRPIEVV